MLVNTLNLSTSWRIKLAKGPRSKIGAAIALQNIRNQKTQPSGLDSSWDYVGQTAERARITLHEQIAVIMEARALLQGAGRYDGEASVLISSISKDLDTAASEWELNNNRRTKISGAAQSASEHGLILDICSGFIQIVERLLSAHSLTVARISEIVNEVYSAAAAANNGVLPVVNPDTVDIKEVL